MSRASPVSSLGGRAPWRDAPVRVGSPLGAWGRMPPCRRYSRSGGVLSRTPTAKWMALPPSGTAVTAASRAHRRRARRWLARMVRRPLSPNSGQPPAHQGRRDGAPGGRARGELHRPRTRAGGRAAFYSVALHIRSAVTRTARLPCHPRWWTTRRTASRGSAASGTGAGRMSGTTPRTRASRR